MVTEETWPEVLDVHPDSWGCGGAAYSKTVQAGDQLWFYLTGAKVLLGSAHVRGEPFRAVVDGDTPSWEADKPYRYPIAMTPMIIRDPQHGVPTSLFVDFPDSVALKGGLAPWGTGVAAQES